MKRKYILIFFLLFILGCVVYWYNNSENDHGYLTIVDPPLLKRKTSRGLLDLEDFRHILVPRNYCRSLNDSNDVNFILIVTSYSGEVIARNSLRNAYPIDELFEMGIWRIFLLGKTKGLASDVSQLALEDENRRFGDLLQGNFNEAYKNLTYKHVMGLKWASTACVHVQYVMKMDDDIAVDLYKIVNLVKSRNASFDILGRVFKHFQPIRNIANKWYVSQKEYDRTFYPKFVSGWFYVTTTDFAGKVADKAGSLPYFWIDDVFLTGMVANLFNCRFVNLGSFSSPEILNCCMSHNVFCNPVGNTGGDFSLQIRFKEYSKKCYFTKACQVLPQERNISQICLTKMVLPQLRSGYPIIRKIKL